VAALKCSRLGGGAGMPTRAEVDAFWARAGAAATA
jgi:sugar/nucleoside kinase (ribokinase family)